VTLANTGARDGDEVLQLYVKTPSSGETQPLKALKGFSRVRLLKGEVKTVSIPLAVRDLRTFSERLDDYVVTPGTYTLEIGPSSADVRLRSSLHVSALHGR